MLRRLLRDRWRRWRTDAERGAVAVLVGVLMVAMVGTAAFVTDYGLAYVYKARLQTAADAAALAAASAYTGQIGECAPLVADGTLAARARTAALSRITANFPSGVRSTSIRSACTDQGLQVTVRLTARSGTFFSPVIGGGSTIGEDGTAAATISNAAKQAGNLRPWPICSGVLNTSGNVTFVPMKGGSLAGVLPADPCGVEGPPGGWWVAQCTGQGNGTGSSTDAVLYGCPQGSYRPVPNQPSGLLSALQLRSFLVDACPNRADNDTCITSDNGNNFHLTSSAWQTLVGQSFTMPVVCTQPTCLPTMAYSGSGQNASYPIYKMATVTLCGFWLKPAAASTGWPTTGACATRNPLNYVSSSLSTGGGLFVVITRITGSVGEEWRLKQYSGVSLTQ